jgi:Ca2+-binding EF-hand superfamily protein
MTNKDEALEVQCSKWQEIEAKQINPEPTKPKTTMKVTNKGERNMMTNEQVMMEVDQLLEEEHRRLMHEINKQEFYFGLRDYGVGISKRESEIILDYLDTEEDGFVNLDAFLQAIRGKPSATRQSWIDKTWSKIDKEGNGYVTAYDIRQIFDCSQHPRVTSGELCFDEVFTQFLQSFGDKN